MFKRINAVEQQDHQENNGKKKNLVKKVLVGTVATTAVAGAAYLMATKCGVKPPKVGISLVPNYDPANDPNMTRGTIIDTFSGKKFDGYWFDGAADELVFFTQKDGILK